MNTCCRICGGLTNSRANLCRECALIKAALADLPRWEEPEPRSARIQHLAVWGALAFVAVVALISYFVGLS
jgi:hypothetical protein